MISQFGLSLIGGYPTKVKTPHGGVTIVLLINPGIDPTKDNTTPAGCITLSTTTKGTWPVTLTAPTDGVIDTAVITSG